MKDAFKNTYFGKPYLTRNGKKALYLWGNKKEGHSLIIENDIKKPHHYDSDGNWYALDGDSPLDIVSEYKSVMQENIASKSIN